MAESSKQATIPTNEEVINEITRDLEQQCINNDNEKQCGDNLKVGESSTCPIPEEFEHCGDKNTDDCDDKQEVKSPVPEDFIDEEAIKRLDEASTEEELLRRKDEALKLKLTGNEEFKTEKYLQSIHSYTEALRLCPLVYENDRSVFYCNRAASKTKLARNESAIDDCTKAIQLNPKYLKAYLRRAKLYEEADKLEDCLADYQKILELDPGHNEARAAAIRLPPIINEKNEKLKAEMLGKLKDLGNMILRPFGLSTDNFKLQQDPNSGGYSVNFQQKQ